MSKLSERAQQKWLRGLTARQRKAAEAVRAAYTHWRKSRRFKVPEASDLELRLSGWQSQLYATCYYARSEAITLLFGEILKGSRWERGIHSPPEHACGEQCITMCEEDARAAWPYVKLVRYLFNGEEDVLGAHSGLRAGRDERVVFHAKLIDRRIVLSNRPSNIRSVMRKYDLRFLSKKAPAFELPEEYTEHLIQRLKQAGGAVDEAQKAEANVEARSDRLERKRKPWGNAEDEYMHVLVSFMLEHSTALGFAWRVDAGGRGEAPALFPAGKLDPGYVIAVLSHGKCEEFNIDGVWVNVIGVSTLLGWDRDSDRPFIATRKFPELMSLVKKFKLKVAE